MQATHIFSAKILTYMAYLNDQSFNDTLTNDIVSFEQVGPVVLETSTQSKLEPLWKLVKIYMRINAETQWAETS